MAIKKLIPLIIAFCTFHFSYAGTDLDWTNLSATQCPNPSSGNTLSILNGSFLHTRVQEEVLLALNEVDSHKKELHFANAIQMAKSNDYDQYCLFTLFQSMGLTDFSQEAYQNLFYSFVKKGGIHLEIPNLNSTNSPFLYWHHLSEKLNGDLLYSQKFFSQILFILKIFFALLFAAFFLYFLFSYGDRNIEWNILSSLNKYDFKTKNALLLLIFAFSLWVHPVFGFWLCFFYWSAHLKKSDLKKVYLAMACLLCALFLHPFSQFLQQHPPSVLEQFHQSYLLPASRAPDPAAPPLLRCLYYFKQGDIPKLESAFEDLTYHEPNHPYLPLFEGALHYLNQNYSNAAESFQAASTNPKTQWAAFYNLNHTYQKERSLSNRALKNTEAHSQELLTHNLFLKKLPEHLQNNHNVNIVFPFIKPQSLFFQSAISSGVLRVTLLNLLWLLGFPLFLSIRKRASTNELSTSKIKEVRYLLQNSSVPLKRGNKQSWHTLLPFNFHSLFCICTLTWMLWELRYGSNLRSIIAFVILCSDFYLIQTKFKKNGVQLNDL